MEDSRDFAEDSRDFAKDSRDYRHKIAETGHQIAETLAETAEKGPVKIVTFSRRVATPKYDRGTCGLVYVSWTTYGLQKQKTLRSSWTTGP